MGNFIPELVDLNEKAELAALTLGALKSEKVLSHFSESALRELEIRYTPCKHDKDDTLLLDPYLYKDSYEPEKQAFRYQEPGMSVPLVRHCVVYEDVRPIPKDLKIDYLDCLMPVIGFKPKDEHMRGYSLNFDTVAKIEDFIRSHYGLNVDIYRIVVGMNMMDGHPSIVIYYKIKESD